LGGFGTVWLWLSWAPGEEVPEWWEEGVVGRGGSGKVTWKEGVFPIRDGKTDSGGFVSFIYIYLQISSDNRSDQIEKTLKQISQKIHKSDRILVHI
jgi:hypothetical protein